MTDTLDRNLASPEVDSRAERLDSALNELAAAAGRLTPLRAHWRGDQPAAFLSSEAAESLNNRLRRLSVNYPRLAVLALSERIRLSGITDDRAGRPLADNAAADLWDSLTDAGIADTAATVTTDRLFYGSAYATVWATEAGRLTVTADAPNTMTHAADPATGDTLYAVRAWSSTRAGAHAVLFEPDRITRYRQPGSSEPIPGSGWVVSSVVDNPLGVVPVVPFVRRTSATDPATGDSLVADILDLTDAVAKLLADAMVTSEFYARPRRWATGLEIQEDEDGNPVDPFGTGRFLQSEAPETKFGQLDPAGLDGYADLIATLTQQIGALTGLPASYLGLHGDQPPSSDAVKAAEVQLTMRAYTEQERMTRPWEDVAWLAAAVEAGAPALPEDRRRYRVHWASPEIRTQAQASDAAAKLAGIGIPLRHLLTDPLGYPPEVVDEIAEAARQSQIITAAISGRTQ